MAFLFGENMDSKSALKELQSFQKTRKGAGDYYTDYKSSVGADEAQARKGEMKEAIRTTEAQLKGVGESVAGRTRGRMVDESSRSRLQALEEQPIQETLRGQQTGYSDIAQEYTDLLGQAGTQAGMAYQTDADRLASMEGNYQKLYEKEKLAEERRIQAATAAEERRRWEAEIADRRAQQAASDKQFWAQLNATKATSDRDYAAQMSTITQNQKNQDKADKAIAVQKAYEKAIEKNREDAASRDAQWQKDSSWTNIFKSSNGKLFGLF
jgi:hypothetical protein